MHGLQFLCCVISVFGLEKTLEQIVQKNQIRLIIRIKKFLQFILKYIMPANIETKEYLNTTKC